ncbi:MAG: hypothetical protein ACRDRZ_17310 [Pseudonocardiaceae bacterium]
MNTEIIGDPEACRASGEWLRSLAEGATDSGVMLHQVSTNSEHCWGDAVGDAFRNRIEAGHRDSGALADEIGRMGDAVVNLGDDLAEARATMSDARLVAFHAGLHLTETTIESPVMPDVLTNPTPSIQLEDIVAENRAGEEYRAQLDAYEEATTIVERARSQEREAHDTLARRVDQQQGHLDAIRATSQFFTLATGAAIGPATVYRQATTWSELADTHRGFARQSRQLLDNPALTQSARIAALNDFLLQQGRSTHAARVAASNSRMLSALADSPRGQQVLRRLGTSADDFAGRGATAMSPAVRPLLRAIPAAGVLAAGGGVALDLAAGESPTQAVASNGAGLVVGTGATSLILLAAPGGPGAVAAVAAGVGMSLLANYTVDQMMSERVDDHD